MNREETRVKCYGLAAAVIARLSTDPDPKETAERFCSFVGEIPWKLTALETALGNAKYRTKVENALKRAQEIADFVEPPKIVTQASTRTPPKREGKKRGR